MILGDESDSRQDQERLLVGRPAEYLDAAAGLTAAPVVDKYLGKLAGADVFTVDNAFAMFESLRIDAGALGPFGIRP